jgi:hypothetical protein
MILLSPMGTGFAIENEIVELVARGPSPPTDPTERRKKESPSSSTIGGAFNG